MQLYEEVKLADGRSGFIIDIYETGCRVEFATPDGEHAYDDEFVPFGEIIASDDRM